MHQDDPHHDECIRTIEIKYVTDLLRAIQFQNTDECLVLLVVTKWRHSLRFVLHMCFCKLQLKVLLLLLIAIVHPPIGVQYFAIVNVLKTCDV